MTLSRREFLGIVGGVGAIGLVGAPALIGLTRKSPRIITGGFADDGMAAGHALRDGTPSATPARIERVPVVIVGGGVAGLSAAWELDRRGMHDLVVLELLETPAATLAPGATP